ncbi:glycosyltransferase family 4 protein [Alkalicoccus halolimnae]|uniref:Glycosyltransferase family 4 protein n=1 Tax=Alkalicoccus halolimnae TaxID=1667239 RepID=A0A5C7FI95_9BACI|nr:glycosyltransferase family 4 protein [Alkalicoccus halolimnae]TXF87037.1 glycosyltransferase family 4 protein [Alkalicoccus halolimnae]
MFIVDNNLETVGGEQESTKIIVSNMKKHHRVGVIQPGPAIDDKQTAYFELTEQTRLKHLIKKPLQFLSYINKVRKLVNKQKPAVIHSQAQVSFFIVSLLKFLKMIPKSTTLVHTERGLYSKYSFPIKLIFFFFMRQLDVLVTTTNHNNELWEKGLSRFSYSKNLTFRVIENTAGELFEKASQETELENAAADTIKVGFVGRYCDWKNWPLAEEVVQNLKERFSGDVVVFMAVGCLDEKSEKETNQMFERMTKTFGENFTGIINAPLSEMSSLYHKVDYYILTSNPGTESFGRTLVEAMSKNTIVLTTPAGGAEEVVGKQANVCHTAEEFTDTILAYHENAEEEILEKQRGLSRVQTTYSTYNNVSKHRSLYQEELAATTVHEG